METYTHQEGKVNEIYNPNTSKQIQVTGQVREHRINYDNKSVLVCEYDVQHNGQPAAHVVVPGRMVKPNGIESKVEPITDRRERTQLVARLRLKGLRGEVKFWE